MRHSWTQLENGKKIIFNLTFGFDDIKIIQVKIIGPAGGLHGKIHIPLSSLTHIIDQMEKEQN